MGLIVQHDDIIALLKKLNIYNGDELIIYATLKTSKPFYVKMNYLNLDKYIVQGVWLAVSKEDVKFLTVSQLGKLHKEVITIPHEDISDFNVKKNLLLYTISITDWQKNVVQFKVASKVFGNKKHHADFIELINQTKE
ncbi:hypothetical protein IGJ55_002757 [Enterococcus sp. AZ170]|uniref:hypothetical protein n=1 Tax=unclassified Enterococcus TaxID=2608891 RepID=UPI003D29BC2C